MPALSVESLTMYKCTVLSTLLGIGSACLSVWWVLSEVQQFVHYTQITHPTGALGHTLSQIREIIRMDSQQTAVKHLVLKIPINDCSADCRQHFEEGIPLSNFNKAARGLEESPVLSARHQGCTYQGSVDAS